MFRDGRSEANSFLNSQSGLKRRTDSAVDKCPLLSHTHLHSSKAALEFKFLLYQWFKPGTHY